MSNQRPLLIEIGCEELPARLINSQLSLLSEGIAKHLIDAGLCKEQPRIERFGTPRRLAIRIAGVRTGQDDQVLERTGPAEKVAFDEDGHPTRAAEGFARSVGQPVDQLELVETDQGRRLFARVEQPGQTLSELLPGMFEATVGQMAGARSMRWSDRTERFLRPVRWLVVLHGSDIIELEYFGLQATDRTRGHRIHAPGDHAIGGADNYERTLREAYVLADPAERIERIRGQCEKLAAGCGLEAVLGEGLLGEVAGLTEWPVAVVGRFDPEFLEVPEEALISSMEQHQKCFALRDDQDRLAPRFIAVANIESTDPEAMTAGFERVIRPRLSDARFFWDQDRKTPLAEKRDRLDGILFQERLGTIGEKVRRLEQLAPRLSGILGADAETTATAAGLCKCDLVTEMVGEFPELQGIMGRHYAVADGHPADVAAAIESHYRPRHAGDELASDDAGLALGLADRLDTLVGIFAAGQKPKGGKDPYALRRAALGVVRMLDHSGCDRPLGELLRFAADPLDSQIEIGDELLEEVEQFIMERLRPWAAESGIETNTVHAVAAGKPGSVADFMARARAVQKFADDPAVASLIAANKRASNLIKQSGVEAIADVDSSLLQIEEEKRLFDDVVGAESSLESLLSRGDYSGALTELARLREGVDRFFDEVMVMVDDESLKANRLALLNRLRNLFLNVADVARLGR